MKNGTGGTGTLGERPTAAATPWLYLDGDFVRMSEVRLTPSIQALNYGTGVFEGIRAYWNSAQQELYALRLRDHYERFADSCGFLRLDLPASADELVDVTVDLLRRNGHRGHTYIRPLAYKRSFEPGVPFGVKLRGVTTSLSLHTVPMGSTVSGLGLRCGVSSWRRIPDTSLPARAKITGGYANNALAVDEVHAAGFDEAILLNQAGTVAEASTSNVFLVRRGELVTPPPSADILEGITRACVTELARDELGTVPVERAVARSELYTADEVFLTGTGIEIQPVCEVDGRKVGRGVPGPVTTRLRELYHRAVRGEDDRYRHWLTPVEL
ncbi:branched-chain amino acid transaminase [Streptomyces sp. TRM 70361]|uniref:branched-chain amino acid transaminase n=1 Tax=Streptomyces sp. TRM 70361 TaxID=3116553 RepID=UPI002E7BF98B|nr:branched-chain amino acid transaminase [Streptomyces sp. TRM 70361]MEE1938782.1 branched-chain amino acid transaminase [Streptomyces sp. TRM 70361]